MKRSGCRPNYAAAYFNRGLAFRRKGELDHAIADYDQAIRLDPREHIRLSIIAASPGSTKGEYDHAIADYNQAIRLDPNMAAAYSNRGDAWRGKGDFVRATADFDRAIKLSPQFALAYDNRGLVSYQKQDYDHAIADFNAAIQLDPNNAQAYNNRGNAYADKGDRNVRDGGLRSGHSTRSEERRHPLRPRHSIAPQRRYRPRHRRIKRSHPARPAACRRLQRTRLSPIIRSTISIAPSPTTMQAIKLNPQFAVAYNNRGNAYDDKGDLDHAITDYNAALKIDAELCRRLLQSRHRLAAQRRSRPGHRRLRSGDKAQSNCDGLQQPRQRLGCQRRNRPRHGRSGSGDQARSAACRMPTSTAATPSAQRLDLAGAIADYTVAISLAPNALLAYYNRAWAHYLAGESPDALTDINRAIALDDHSANAYLDARADPRKARRYRGRGRRLPQALKLDPRFAQPAEALKRLSAGPPKSQ